MRILFDQNIDARIPALLSAETFDAVHTRDLGLSRASDAEILDYARRDGRVIGQTVIRVRMLPIG